MICIYIYVYNIQTIFNILKLICVLCVYTHIINLFLTVELNEKNPNKIKQMNYKTEAN